MAETKKTAAKTNSHGAKTREPAAVREKKVPLAKKHATTNVALRAYEIYLERKKNGIPGSSESDWMRAEKEIRGN
ncbi:MAG: DUF2934 domain-containing protein [Spirochaetales bacterium]|nr:DUF2934 domain-containing protein [Spirochaetales bacterium]